MASVSGLYRYPVKSCAGESLSEMTLGDLGPQGDREWMFVHPDGVMLTQRKFPKMALIKPETTSGGIRISAPDLPAIDVLKPVAPANRTAEIFDKPVRVADVSPDAGAWASEFLGTEVQLVTTASDHQRQVNPKRAPIGRHVGFADGYPILITSESSLDALVAEATEPFPMNRFRPNIVIRGSEPWEEDTWSRVRIGQADIDVMKPCPRCPIPNVDQSVGERRKEPAKVLAKMRRVDGETLFGVNAMHARPGDVIKLGDAILVSGL